MSNGDIFDGDATIFAEVTKVMASKCSSKVGDDIVRQDKPMDDVFKQLGCFLCCSLNEGFVLDPLRELVDVDIDLVEPSWHGLKGLDHIQSLAYKGPRCRNRSQGLSWDVDLLGEELAILISVNECFSIDDG